MFSTCIKLKADIAKALYFLLVAKQTGVWIQVRAGHDAHKDGPKAWAELETEAQARVSQHFWDRACECALRGQYCSGLWWPELTMEDQQLGQWWGTSLLRVKE